MGFRGWLIRIDHFHIRAIKGRWTPWRNCPRFDVVAIYWKYARPRKAGFRPACRWVCMATLTYGHVFRGASGDRRHAAKLALAIATLHAGKPRTLRFPELVRPISNCDIPYWATIGSRGANLARVLRPHGSCLAISICWIADLLEYENT